jgi:hypothetical protein
VGQPPCNKLSQPPPVTLVSRSPLLQGRCSRQLRKSCASANMVYSRVERMFILEHYLTSKSFAAVREAFSNAYLDKEVLNKTTIHRLVTKFRETGSVCDRKHVRRRTCAPALKLFYKFFLTKTRKQLVYLIFMSPKLAYTVVVRVAF